MQITYVEDWEIIYRRIQAGKGYYGHSEKNGLEVNTQAFLDENSKPSVDRAELCNNEPKYSQIDDTDGVVSLVVNEVRNIDIDEGHSQPSPNKPDAIDVVHRPTTEPKINNAHAQIEAQPQITTRGPFRRLRTRLAILVNKQDPASRWLIRPDELE